jgi:glycosyltransferase involved in cell wall biosynthesis
LGHQVSILALHSDYQSLTQKERKFIWHGVEVRYVSQMHVLKAGSQKRYFSPLRLLSVVLIATWKLTLAALRLKADLYWVGKPHPMNGIAGVVAARLKGAGLVVDCDDYEAESNRFSGRWQKRILWFFERSLPRLADWVTYHSQYLGNLLVDAIGVSPEQLARLPNGVDRERFRNCELWKLNLIRGKLQLPTSKVVGYIGSMSLDAHAIDLLIDAFPYVIQAQPEAKLLMVGGGQDLDYLRAKVAKLGLESCVIFTGYVDWDVVSCYYALVEMIVDPVRDTPGAASRFPLKIVEGLALGIPIVTGDVGDRRMLLADGRAGILVPPGSSKALASAIVELLNDEALCHAMSDVAQRISENYYWDAIVRRDLPFLE